MAYGERAKTSLGHGANTSISYNSCIRSTDVVSGLYLRSVHSGRIAFEVEVVVHGVIMEVVVLTTVVEVAVHAEVVELDGSVTRVFGDGSDTRVEEELGVSTCRGTWRSTDVVVLIGPGLANPKCSCAGTSQSFNVEAV